MKKSNHQSNTPPLIMAHHKRVSRHISMLMGDSHWQLIGIGKDLTVSPSVPCRAPLRTGLCHPPDGPAPTLMRLEDGYRWYVTGCCPCVYIRPSQLRPD